MIRALISIAISCVIVSCAAALPEERDRYEIEGLTGDMRGASELIQRPDGRLYETGKLKLALINKGDITYASRKSAFSKPENKQVLGSIVFEVDIVKVDDETYDNQINLGFDFPEKDGAGADTAWARMKGRVTVDQIAALKKNRKTAFEANRKVSELLWINMVEEGTRSDYQYSEMFRETSFKEAIIEIGGKYLDYIPEIFELLIEKYPEGEKILKMRGEVAKI
ncbi:MAG: hypothetical protein WC592_04090 [Candidatus Omnitrophota bacterium]|nr:hypothetical protein [Candidatus Omnitrophota bacterium]